MLLAGGEVCTEPVSLHPRHCRELCYARGEEGELCWVPNIPQLGSSQQVSAPNLSSGCSAEEAANQGMVGMGSEKSPGAEEEVLDFGVQVLRRHYRSWSKKNCKRQAQSTSPCCPEALHFVPGDLAGLLIPLAAG